MKPIISVVENDVRIEREMNNEEYNQYLIDQDTNKIKAKETQDKEAARAALLEKLGITADEAKLLLG